MKKVDELYTLIQSLDKNERGYFKKFCSIYGREKDHNYLLLFEYIARQRVYDEAKLLKHFQREKFIRQLSVAKHYLFTLVMKSLESYHSSLEAGLASALHQVEILFEKGLYDHCTRILERTKKTAIRYERFTFLLQLFKWEIELARARSYAGITEQEIRRLFENIFKTIEQFKTVNEYSVLVSQIFLKEMKGGFARTKSELKSYDRIIRTPLLSSEKQASTYQSRYYYYLSHIGYHSIRNEYQKAFTYSRKLVNLLETNPHQVAVKPRTYLSALKNLASCLGKLKRYSEIPAEIKKMRLIKTRSQSLRNSIFYSANILDLETCLHTGAFDKGIELVKEFEEQRVLLNTKALNQLNETILNYNSCCICFGAGNYPAANQYLNRILNETNVDLRSDIHCFARILSLLIHYEMGNDDLLSYLIKSTYRYLLKRKHLFRFETLLLQFIRKELPKTTTKKELITAFEGLKNAIIRVSRDPFEQTALEYFDLISWLESKIENRAFSDVVREKAKKTL